MDNLERQLINEQLAKCIELSEKYNQLVSTFNRDNFLLPKNSTSEMIKSWKL